MVKIRYSELPAGLHVRAESRGRDTVIYLLPGLTPAQRRAALIRVRSGSRMGHGPRLPAASMALAIASDRLRTTVTNGAAAMRGHPVLLLLPPLILLVSGAIVFVLMSFVTLTVPQHDRAQSWAPSVVVPSGSQSAHGRSSRQPGGQLVVAPSGSGSGPAGHGGRRPQPTANPTPTPSGSASPIPVVSSPAPSASATSGTPSPTPDPSPSPSESQSGTCVKLGPLGLCLTL
jgi:hypothetical protein